MNSIHSTQHALVSVIIPCYNAEKTLQQTVASVQQQVYQNWEIIIINDGSTDRSGELANKLAKQHNIRVIHTKNQGVSKARNSAVEIAHGKYLAFLDADDLWHPGKLSKQLHAFQLNNQLGVCFSKVRFISSSGQTLNQYSSVPAKALSAFGLLYENHLCTSSNIMCRKQVFIEIGGFDTTMSYAEDQEWLLRVALKNHWQVAGINDVLIDYRTQTDSLSSSLTKMEQGWETLIRKVSTYAPEFIQQNYDRSQAVYLRYLARRALRQGEPASVGLSYIKRALQADWRIIFVSPWRSLATLLGLVCWGLSPSVYTARIFQISQ